MTEKPHIPFNTQSFIDRIKPGKNTMPLDELKQRLADDTRDKLGLMPFGDALHGVDQIVEVRIRRWMQREKNGETTAPKTDESATNNDLSRQPKKSSPPKI